MTVYRTYIPEAPLANFVEKFWLYEDNSLPHSKERRLPDGAMELVINLREDTLRVYDRENHDRFQSFRGCLMSGAHAEFCVIDTSCQASIMGIHFKPGGASPFLGMPASELHDAHVSLDTLWGTATDDLRDQLLEASTPQVRFRILEQSLMAHMACGFRGDRLLARHPAIAFALKEFQGAPGIELYRHTRTISDVAERIGLSQKRFIQIFSDEVGLTPKLFCRVRRFQEVLRLINTGRQIEWADIALSCGYFDQAHFIHDFRAFSGLNPTAYLAQRGEHHNHVPLSN